MTTLRKRIPIKLIAKLLARHGAEEEKLRLRFSANAERLDRAIALGAPLNVPIDLPDRRGTVMVLDQFATKNVAFKSAACPRYVVKPFRSDRDRLPTRPRRAEETVPWTALSVECPLDQTPVRVRASDGQNGLAVYGSASDEWYISAPRTAHHGRRWQEVRGRTSHITHWRN